MTCRESERLRGVRDGGRLVRIRATWPRPGSRRRRRRLAQARPRVTASAIRPLLLVHDVDEIVGQPAKGVAREVRRHGTTPGALLRAVAADRDRSTPLQDGLVVLPASARLARCGAPQDRAAPTLL